MRHAWSRLLRACCRRAFLALALVTLVAAPLRLVCLERDGHHRLDAGASLADLVAMDLTAGADDGQADPGETGESEACGACHCAAPSGLLPEVALAWPRPAERDLMRSPARDRIPDQWPHAPEPPPNRI